MYLVTEEDAKGLIKAMRCTPTTRRRGNKDYLYARRRAGKAIKEKCISAIEDLPTLTREQVQRKIIALLEKVEQTKMQNKK